MCDLQSPQAGRYQFSLPSSHLNQSPPNLAVPSSGSISVQLRTGADIGNNMSTCSTLKRVDISSAETAGRSACANSPCSTLKRVDISSAPGTVSSIDEKSSSCSPLKRVDISSAMQRSCNYGTYTAPCSTLKRVDISSARKSIRHRRPIGTCSTLKRVDISSARV